MLRSSAPAVSVVMTSQQNIMEIIQLLESKNINVIEETSTLVRSTLNSSPEPWLLNALVDYYISSGNVLARRLLTGVREPQHKNLLIKLDEYLQKSGTRYSALNLFGHVVRKDPIWIHHLVKSHAFSTVLKFLLHDNDVNVLTNALYVVATLLPKVPTRIGQNLSHVFCIYVRLAAWNMSKQITMTEGDRRNFEMAHFALFLCLYGMYPCGFVAFLRQNYCRQQSTMQTTVSAAATEQPSSVQQDAIFREIVLPMLQQVRLHPNLILYSKELEVMSERWRKTECHDVVGEISQIRLDEGEPFTSRRLHPAVKEFHVSEDKASVSNVLIEKQSSVESSELDESSASASMIWSPSMEIGLSTPPSSRNISPSRDMFDQKIKNDNCKAANMQDSGKTKNRPGTFNMPASLHRDISHSGPGTPTQGNFSFEFGKVNVMPDIDASVSCELSSVLPISDLNQQADKLSGFHTPDAVLPHLNLHVADEDFASTGCDGQEDNKSGGLDKRITDFSPALWPAADSSSQEGVQPALGKRTDERDSPFISVDSPSIQNIIGFGVAQNLSSAEVIQKELQLATQGRTPRFNHREIDWQHLLNEADMATLKSAFLQMHCALLHEQHRREQHATMARRLMRKVYEFSALELNNETQRQRLKEKENEVFYLQSTVKAEKTEFRKKEETLQNALRGCQEEMAESSKNIKVLKAEIDALKLSREKDLKEFKETKTRLDTTQSELCRCKLQLQCESKNKEMVSDLESQVVQLQKELLIVKELGTVITSATSRTSDLNLTDRAKSRMLIDSHKQHLAKLTEELREQSVLFDATKRKCTEMEKLVEKKNCVLVEQKKYLENVKSLARSQIQAMESKYQAQKSITVQMEVQVMELYSRLCALEGHASSENIEQIGSKPILQHQHGLQSRYGHLNKASPELSPPIKINPLEEPSVATSELEASTIQECDMK